MGCNAQGVVLQLCGAQDRRGEEDSGRIKGGKAGGANRVEEEEASAKRADLLERTEGRKKISEAFHISLHSFIRLPFFQFTSFFSSHLDSLLFVFSF